MSSPATIHDAFFKKVLSDQRAADLFLREHLPRDVVELLTPQPPELLPGSFVDEELGQHHSDLLFQIQLKTGQDALAYLLVEHKSSPDALVRLQLLRGTGANLVAGETYRRRVRGAACPHLCCRSDVHRIVDPSCDRRD